MANNNPTSYTNLRKFLNGIIKGPFIDAVLNSLAVGDDLNESNIIAAKDQLFIATATGTFLDKLLAGLGITRPPGVGITDDLIREIAIKQTNSKLVSNIFLDLLEVFYGADAVRANVLSGLPERYNLTDGMTLKIFVDTNPTVLEVVFHTEDFSNITRATAAEVSNAISNFAFNAGYSLTASSQKDINTGLNYIQLLSGTRGPKSSITVVGGAAQNVFKFPKQEVAIPKIGTQFSFSFVDDFVRFTWTGGPDPSLGLLSVGDYANIYGNQFLPQNQGSYIIQNLQGGPVGQSYFDILNPNFVPQSPVTLTGLDSQSGNGTATRTINIQFAPNGTSRTSNVTTVTTMSNHGLSIGQQITIQDVINPSFNGIYTVSNVVSGTQFQYLQTNQPDAVSGGGTVLQIANIQSVANIGAVRTSGTVTINTINPHGFTLGQTVDIEGIEDSSFDSTFIISATPTTTSFQYIENYSNDLTFYTPKRITIQSMPRYASVYEVNPYEVVIFLPATTAIVRRSLIGSAHLQANSRSKLWNGPYIYDPKKGLPISSIFTSLTTQINEGSLDRLVFGTDTSLFPDNTGFLMFDFATDKQEGPVKYFGRPSSGSLLIDPAYKFKFTHDVGSDVTLLRAVTPYQPKQDGSDYAAFLTDTTIGRIEVISLIEGLAASGISLSIFVIYPAGPGIQDIPNIVYAGDLSSLDGDF